MKKLLVILAKILKAIPFASIITGALKSVGGLKGFILGLFVKPIVKSAEEKGDGVLSDYIETVESDEKIDEQKVEHIKKQEEAVTDAEFDQASDDSFR